MNIKTKYNIGDTLYYIWAHGHKEITSDRICPYCANKTNMPFATSSDKCEMRQVHYDELGCYTASCNNGKIQYKCVEYGVRQLIVTEINAWVTNNDFLTEYVGCDTFKEMTESELYASEKEALEAAQKKNQQLQTRLIQYINKEKA